MKKIFLLLSLICALALTSCTSDIEEFNADDYDNDNSLTISVTMPGADTRMSTDDLTKMVWEEGDVIYALGYKNEKPTDSISTSFPLGVSTLKLVSEPGGKSAVFKGDPVPSATSYYFAYSNKLNADDLKNYMFISYDNINNTSYGQMIVPGFYWEQSQTVVNSTAHLKNELILISDKEVKDFNKTGRVKLGSIFGILRINVKHVPRSLKAAGSCNISFNEGYLNINTKLGTPFSEGPDNYIYLAFKPSYDPFKGGESVKAGTGIKVEFDTGKRKFIARGSVSKDIEYKAGMIYTMVIDSESTGKERAVVWESNYDWDDTINPARSIQLKFNGAAPDVVASFVNKGLVKETGYYAYLIPDSITEIGGFAQNNNITDAIIPAKVTKLKADAFKGCKNLKTAQFAAGSKLEVIDNNCFDNCTALENIIIPAGVTRLGKNAFGDCNKLGTLNFDRDARLSVIDDSCFVGCSSLGSITFPASITRLGKNAFEKCTNLNPVQFAAGSKLEVIDDYCFYECTSLEKISFPASLTTLGMCVLTNCEKLGMIKFDDNAKIKKIGAQCFANCGEINVLTFPSSVKEIGRWLLRGSIVFNLYIEFAYPLDDSFKTSMENLFGNPKPSGEPYDARFCVLHINASWKMKIYDNVLYDVQYGYVEYK